MHASLSQLSARPCVRHSGKGRRVLHATGRNVRVRAGWEYWTATLDKVAQAKPPKEVASSNGAWSSEALAQAIKSAAAEFKPSVPFQMHFDPNATYPTLHKRLEVAALFQLQSYLENPDLSPLSLEFTTTDIDAALQVAGVAVNKRGKKSAVFAFVAAESVPQTSWSKLEGVLLHWGCTRGADKWELPPLGWKTLPARSEDAGGAWQSEFEKMTIGSFNDAIYTLIVEVPLTGPLETGGLTFVLKTPATKGNAQRWLKNAKTLKDFVVDVQKFPVVMAA